MNVLLKKEGAIVITCHKDFVDFLVLAYHENWKGTSKARIEKQFKYPKEFPCIVEYNYYDAAESGIEDSIFSGYKFNIKYKEDLKEYYNLLKELFK